MSNIDELDVDAKVLFFFDGVDSTVCRSTAAFVFQAMSLRQEISFVKKVLFLFWMLLYIFFSLTM